MESITTAPEGLTAPKYGAIEIGDTLGLHLDEREGEPAMLYIDTNGDGDLNDPETKWESKAQGEFTMYNGTGQVDGVRQDRIVSVSVRSEGRAASSIEEHSDGFRRLRF
jgi:hypothetical protein